MIDKSSQRATSPWLSSKGDLAHPSSPIGGGGPGKFVIPMAYGRARNNSDPIPHPLSPNARSRALRRGEMIALARAGIGGLFSFLGAPARGGTGGSIAGTDISAPKRQILTSFGVYQMKNNPAGIGNECTHWIYAALFEARALDSDATLHIHQTAHELTWGRPVNEAAVQRGDITQFYSFLNRFFIYLPDGKGGARWWELTKIRGPQHTGMVFVPPRSGTYYQLEAHLHEPGTTVMRVRGHTIYYESFAVSISTSDFPGVRGSKAWPANINPADSEDLLERVDWVELRTNRSIDLKVAALQINRIRQNKTPTIGGKDVAVLFRVLTTGSLRFFCPQASTARLAMTPEKLAAEKLKVIDMMKKSGRKGGKADEDQYGGDNKKLRIHDQYFDWTYPQP